MTGWRYYAVCLAIWFFNWSVCFTQALRVLETSTLGPDPQTVNRLNGESFQQDALVTFEGHQYAVFWVDDALNSSVRHLSMSRRHLTSEHSPSFNNWQTFTFMDYNQTEDDGHDIISLGIAPSDGTVHISFDHHDNQLKYRVSTVGAALHPMNTTWSADLFGEILDHLPGLEGLNETTYFGSVTYPRFLSGPIQSKNVAKFLFEIRTGRSGLGDDWLYEYVAGAGWLSIGDYLEGVNNNAYINGLDFDSKENLIATWTYRDYVNDTGQDVAVQAGPNGPENNHDMDFSSSPDVGRTWVNNWGQTIARIAENSPIVPASAGITIFSIPKYGGILNQEAQIVDDAGRVHVLNRENTTGVEQWYHYWRSTTAHWTRTPLPLDLPSINNITNTPTVIGKRGKLATIPSSNTLLALLPSNAPYSSAFSVLASTPAGHFHDWSVVWEVGSGCEAEILFDRYRLAQGDGVLSLFMVNGTQVQVVDLDPEM
ncbi:hypothetical protein BV25DRAFT_1880942 [Artomyces pyxidatus]|uniref:Uncharacterized protein n=1 Tax=Artomyces pyxidatus TaxID=48021 RepID=A0ACB8T9T5_9AGAM|nr:hypothetical protein BV25DRAFT_1880942 [Artomyces pyxidatus]